MDVLAAAKLRPNDQVWGAYKAWYDKCLQANGAKIREAIERTEAPEKCFRWKVQLDCGCTTEVLTHELLTYGERRFWAREQLPPDGKAKTFLHFGAETGRAAVAARPPPHRPPTLGLKFGQTTRTMASEAGSSSAIGTSRASSSIHASSQPEPAWITAAPQPTAVEAQAPLDRIVSSIASRCCSILH